MAAVKENEWEMVSPAPKSEEDEWEVVTPPKQDEWEVVTPAPQVSASEGPVTETYELPKGLRQQKDFARLPKPESSLRGRNRSRAPREEEASSGRYTKEQILATPDLIDTIRDMMIRRHGVDYEQADDEKVYDDFLTQERWLENNEFGIAEEMVWLNRASDADKTARAKSFEIYENIEGLFSNDDLGDIASGMGDYVMATLLSPTTYVGLGVGKVLSLGGKKLAMQTIRQGTKEVVKAALKSGAGKEAARKAGKNFFLKEAAKRAAVMGAAEGASSAGMDYKLQDVRQQADPGVVYSPIQTLIAGGLGFAGGALDIVNSYPATSRTGIKSLNKKAKPKVLKEVQREAVDSLGARIEKVVNSAEWEEMIARSSLDNVTLLDQNILRSIFLADPETGTPGIGNLMWKAGYEKADDKRMSHVIMEFLDDLEGPEREAFDKIVQTNFGEIGLTNTKEFSDQVGKVAHNAATELGIFGEVGREYGASSMSGITTDTLDPKSAKRLPAIRSFEYFQNFWRRMIVSSLQTTGLNVQGSVQYGLLNTVNDALIGGAYLITGQVEKAAKYRRIIGYRARNILTPEKNAELLRQLATMDEKAFNALTRTTAMGTEAYDNAVKAYGLEGASEGLKGVVKVTEKVADIAQRMALVNAQDSYFKAFGLADELNRIAELKYGKSLDDVIRDGEFRTVFDEVDMATAVHNTLKQTFSADYTRRNMNISNVNSFAASLAEMSEKVSNTPGFGFVYPFGRFTNNVVAFTTEWSPVSLLELRKLTGADPRKLGRGMVGLAAWAGMAQYQATKEESLGLYEVKNGATVIDLSNNFPMSMYLVAGEVIKEFAAGQPISQELQREMAVQIGIGAAITDISQAGDPLVGLIELAFNPDGSPNQDKFVGLIGSIVGGFTRPMSQYNDFVSVFSGDTSILDRRQTTAWDDAFVKEAGRYVEHFVRLLSDENLPEKDFRKSALRLGIDYSANPFAKMTTGVNVTAPKTAGEKVMAMAGLPNYKANYYSAHPHFDRVVNEYLGPTIELEARALLVDDAFINGDSKFRRNAVRAMLTRVRGEVLKSIESARRGNGEYVMSVQKRLMKLKEDNRDQYDLAAEKLGLENKDIRKMTPSEVQMLQRSIERVRQLPLNH